jgi:hypothetical protein
MSDHPASPSEPGQAPVGVLSIRVPPDHRFRIVLDTAVRIYVRPICRTSEEVPEVASALAAMVAEVAAADPIDVVLACRLPELDVSVASGDRRRARTFRLEAKG